MDLAAFWSGRRVLVTGHTGFKGAWLCLWLERLGARVAAVALEPGTSPSLYNLLSLGPRTNGSFLDLRNRDALCELVMSTRPEIVLHLAAQALVRQSYANPTETFTSNIIGTTNLLEAVRNCEDVRAVVVVTSDKVYKNSNRNEPFVEGDRLGGRDPYSCSKACVELICETYRESYFHNREMELATARAGNVIGGGDWSEDRLIPDFVRALDSDSPVHLRYPEAVRPWQHVLEPLTGYLKLAQMLIEDPVRAPKAVNFGPDPSSFATVAQVVNELHTAFDYHVPHQVAGGVHLPEALTLTLRSDLAHVSLGWRPRLSLGETLAWTAEWYRAHRCGSDMQAFTSMQIARYEELFQ